MLTTTSSRLQPLPQIQVQAPGHVDAPVLNTVDWHQRTSKIVPHDCLCGRSCQKSTAGAQKAHTGLYRQVWQATQVHTPPEMLMQRCLSQQEWTRSLAVCSSGLSGTTATKTCQEMEAKGLAPPRLLPAQSSSVQASMKPALGHPWRL